jgi:hypothetical protein
MKWWHPFAELVEDFLPQKKEKEPTLENDGWGKAIIDGKVYNVDIYGRFVDINKAEDLPKNLSPDEVNGLTFMEFARWQTILYNEMRKGLTK